MLIGAAVTVPIFGTWLLLGEGLGDGEWSALLHGLLAIVVFLVLPTLTLCLILDVRDRRKERP